MERSKNVIKPCNFKAFCCVNGCNSRGPRDTELSFHVFPKSCIPMFQRKRKDGKLEIVDAKTAWTQILKINTPVTNYMKVCSLHFRAKDFEVPSMYKTNQCLKKNAIPSRNLPTTKSKENQLRSPVNRALQCVEKMDVSDLKKKSIQDCHHQLLSHIESIKYEQLPLETETKDLEDSEQPIGNQCRNQHEIAKNHVKEGECNIDFMSCKQKSLETVPICIQELEESEQLRDNFKVRQQSTKRKDTSENPTNKEHCGRMNSKSNFKVKLSSCRIPCTNEKIFRCDKCSYKSIFESGLIGHRLTHSNDTFNCNECLFKTTDKSDYARHLLVHLHPSRETFKCDKYNYMAYSAQRVKQHMRSHYDNHPRIINSTAGCKGAEKRNCNVCCKDFLVEQEVNHLAQSLVCQKCSEKKRYRCNKCNFNTIYKTSMIRHKQLIHSKTIEKKRDKNSFVGKIVSYSKTQTEKKSEKSGLVEVQFMCHKCDYMTNEENHLVLHSRMHAKKDIECSKCNFKTSSELLFDEHKQIHTGEKPFNCNFCNYRTYFENYLVLHTQTHSGEMQDELEN